MEAKLVSLVEHYMSMHLHDNALFIAECLLAEAPSETNRHLLASVLIQAGRWKAAQAALRDTTTAPNRYLFARCCLEAGEFQEAEDALLTSGGVPPGTALESVIQGFQRAPFKLPNGAAGAHLLAVASLRLGRQEAASKYFMLALYLDPFLFSAFEQLCRMGYFPDPAQSFVQLRLGAHGQQSDRAMHVAEEKKLAAAAAAAAAASATAEAGGGGAHTRTAGVKRAAAVVAGVAASFESGAAAAVAIAAAAGDNAAVATAAAADDRSRRLVVPSPMLLSPITPAARLHMIMTSPAYDGSGSSSEQLQMGQTGSSVSSNWTESSGIAGATPAAVQRNGGSGGAPLFGAPASAIALSLPPGGVSFSIGGGPPLFSGGGGGGGKLSSIAEEGAEGRGRRSGGSAQRGKAESSVSASAMGSSPDDAVVDAAQFRTDEEAEGWEEEEEGGGTGEEVQHAAIDAATSTPSNFSSAAAAPAHMRPPQGGAPTTVTRSAVAQQRRPTRAHPPATAEKPLQLPRSRGARTGARGASSGAVGHDEMDEEGTPAASHSSSATSISSAVAFDWESGGRTGGHRGGGAVPLSGGGGGPLPVVQTLMQTFEEEEHTAAAAASNATASSPSLAQVHPAFASAVPSHRMGGAHRLMAMMSGGAAQHDSSSPSGAADATVTPSGTSSSSSSSSLAFSSLSPIPAPFQNDSVTLMSRVLGGSLSMHADTAAAEHVAAQSLLRGPHGQQQRGSVPPFIRRATAFITPGEAAAQAASRLASAGVQVAGGPTFSTSHDFGYGGGGYSSDAAAASAAALRDLRERGLLRAAPASASARSPFLVDRSGGGGGGARRVLPFRWSGASGDSALAGGGRGSAPPSSAAAAHFMHSGGSGLQHHSHSSADDTGVTPTINFNFGEGNASSAGRRNDQDDGERGEDAPEEEQEEEEAMEEEGGDDVAAAAAADESHASNAAAARGGGGGAHDAPRRGAPRVAAAPSRAAAAVAAVVTSSAAAPPSSSSASSVRAYGMPGPHEQQPPRRYRGTGSPAGGSGSGVGRGTARAHLFGTPAPASAAAAVGGAVSAIAPIAQQQGGARGGGGGDAADAATASAPFSLNAASAGSATALFAANAHRNTAAARATTAAAAPSASAGTAAPFATPGVSNFPTSDRPWLVSAAAKGPFLRAVGEPLLAAATVAHESASPPLPALLSRGTVSVLSLLQQMGYIVRHLWKFESELALQCLDTSLPAHHARASFGLLCTGKARLDRGEYEAARDVFETLRRGSPHRVEGQELHSTALWHLKAVTELTVLAADIATAHPGTWQSLCVLGNAHSLKGDHKAAAAMFKRATEVDPWGAVYAYLLGGQEAIEMGKYEEAGEMLRVGLRKGEPRHYSGWHALGVVYLRTGRNDHALYHFKRATELHRYSPLLHVSYAMALAGQGKFAEALTSLTRALSLDPGHLQALYQRALVYSATGSHAEARADLLAVVARAPHEPAVLVQLGKQCKWVGRLDESVLYWNQALLLLRTDKDANVVKSLLSSVGSPAEAEDVLQI